jgi:HEAT repeat protein
VSRIDGERTLRALVALLDHEDRSLRRTAASAIGSFRAEARPAAAGLMGRLSTTDPAEFREIEDALVAMSVGAPDALEFPRGVVQSPRPRDEGELRSFLDRLRFCATDSAGALPLFVEGLESDDDGVRALSVCGAALFGSEDEAVRARVLDLENDRWKPVRRTVVQATSRFPLDERVIGAVTRALRGSRPENADAARVVALRGPAGAPFLPEVAARLDHGEAFVQAYRAIGGDDDVAVRAVLRDGLESGYVNAIISCLERVGRLGAPSAEGRRRVEPFLEDRDPRVRAAAAFAAAACGGDLAEPTRVILAEHASGVRTVPVYLGAMLEKRLLSEDVLLAMLDDPDPVERAEAARILGRLGAISALPRLREMRSDPDPIAAHNAGEAVNLVEHMPGRGTGERRASGR